MHDTCKYINPSVWFGTTTAVGWTGPRTRSIMLTTPGARHTKNPSANGPRITCISPTGTCVWEQIVKTSTLWVPGSPGEHIVREPFRPGGTTAVQSQARIGGGKKKKKIKKLRMHRRTTVRSTAGRQKALLPSSCCMELGADSARPASFGGEMNGGPGRWSHWHGASNGSVLGEVGDYLWI